MLAKDWPSWQGRTGWEEGKAGRQAASWQQAWFRSAAGTQACYRRAHAPVALMRVFL